MPTPFENAQLNLKLFDLRREPVLREARDWFLREFNPDSFAELVTLAGGKRNTSFRMVLSYWNMATSLVTAGAIDADAFRAAHDEIFATFSKIYLYLAELRAASGEPEFCKDMEAVARAAQRGGDSRPAKEGDKGGGGDANAGGDTTGFLSEPLSR